MPHHEVGGKVVARVGSPEEEEILTLALPRRDGNQVDKGKGLDDSVGKTEPNRPVYHTWAQCGFLFSQTMKREAAHHPQGQPSHCPGISLFFFLVHILLVHIDPNLSPASLPLLWEGFPGRLSVSGWLEFLFLFPCRAPPPTPVLITEVA